MSLYSYSFNYLPPPDRSTTSFGPEDIRARFPNFQNVDEMKEFMMRLFVLQFQINHSFVQIKFGASLFVVIVFNGILITIRRMYDKSFWVARLVKRPSGTIVVPNAILSFAMVESIFIIILVAFLFQCCQFYESHNFKPSNLFLWITLPWCTAILGVYWAMLGSHFATPTRIKPIDEYYPDRMNWVEKLFQNAFMVNFIALGLPIMLCTTVAIPSFFANAYYSKAQRMQDVWQERYAEQIIFTQEMVTEAQLIWYKLLKGASLASITFFMWFVWAVICWIIYTAITVRLITTIYSELSKKVEDDLTFIVTVAHHTPSHKPKGIISHLHADTQDRERRNITIEEPLSRIEENPESQPTNESRGDLSLKSKLKSLPVLYPNQSQSCSTEIGITSSNSNDIAMKDLLKSNSSQNFAFNQSPSSLPAQQQQQQQQIRVKSSTSFFKSFLPNLILTSEMESVRFTESMQESRSEQKKELRKAFLQIFIQMLVMSPACATFAGIALMMALTIHSSFEQPSKDRVGNRFEYFGPVALLCVVYAVIVFGCGASFALLQRTYEPVFSAITTSTSALRSGHSQFSSSGAASSSFSTGKQGYRNIHEVDAHIGIGQSPAPNVKQMTKTTKKNQQAKHILSTFFETRSRSDQAARTSRSTSGHDGDEDTIV